MSASILTMITSIMLELQDQKKTIVTQMIVTNFIFYRILSVYKLKIFLVNYGK